MEKILLMKTKITDDFDLTLGLINQKLAFVGYQGDAVENFYRGYEAVWLSTETESIQKYKLMLENFVYKRPQILTLNDFYLPMSDHFKLLVWETLLNLKAGEYLTYSELAARVARPKAIRYVAACVGQNPILLLIPCHRIVGKNQTLKYRSGPEKKRFLMENGY